LLDVRIDFGQINGGFPPRRLIRDGQVARTCPDWFVFLIGTFDWRSSLGLWLPSRPLFYGLFSWL